MTASGDRSFDEIQERLEGLFLRRKMLAMKILQEVLQEGGLNDEYRAGMHKNSRA